MRGLYRKHKLIGGTIPRPWAPEFPEMKPQKA